MDLDGSIAIVAGTGTAGSSGDNGPAIDAQLNGPTRLVPAPDGSLFFVDSGNYRIRRVGPDGLITTVFQTSSAAPLYDLAVDKQGVLYFTQYAPWTCCGYYTSYYLSELRPGGQPRTILSTDSRSRGPFLTVDAAPDGFLYVGEGHWGTCNYGCGGFGCSNRSGHILRIDSEGREVSIAGGWSGNCGNNESWPCDRYALGLPDGVPAQDTCFSRQAGVALGPDGYINVAHGVNDDESREGADRIGVWRPRSPLLSATYSSSPTGTRAGCTCSIRGDDTCERFTLTRGSRSTRSTTIPKARSSESGMRLLG
jgi:hypothetical protein